jgi:GNAT superfamily N-acetyltransferase
MGYAVVFGEPPEGGGVVVGDFVLPLGAPSRDVLDIIRSRPGDELHLLPAGPRWHAVVEAVRAEGGRAYTREAFLWSEFDRAVLDGVGARLPQRHTLEPVGLDAARELLSEPWSRDVVGNFESPERYVTEAFGFAIRTGGRIVSAAGCYTTYADGIEVEVDTHPAYRRRGLARAAARALLIEGIRRGCAVHWDAMNEASARLARSLGYASSERYECLEIPRKARTGDKR